MSGENAVNITRTLCNNLPPPRQASYRSFCDVNGEIIDEGIVLFFESPHSFTGENVVELQAHGGPVILDMLLQRCLQLGARQARPGEFSERAFVNDKIDLAQAEAIADLIDSQSRQAARSAQRSLQGVFSEKINQLLKKLIELQVYVEAALDFPEEEIDFLSDGVVNSKLISIQSTLEEIQNEARQGQLLRDGMRLVIAGRPNAGKSSLLNILAGKDVAIVTDIAGTTRDILHEQINIKGMPLHITDTAGLHDSDDLIEKMGMQRAEKSIEEADFILHIFDDAVVSRLKTENHPVLRAIPDKKRIDIRNKIDISGDKPGFREGVVYLSASTGEGIDVLRNIIAEKAGFHSEEEGIFIARRRHLDALQRCSQYLCNASTQLNDFQAGELLAEELRQAQQALGEITGEFSSEDLLSEIFSSFCIGK